MAEEIQPTVEVSKSRKRIVFAVLAILVVVGAIVGIAFALGVGPFSAPESESAKTPTPSTDTADQPAEQAPAPAPAPTPAAAVTLPSTDAQAVVYWEQVASEEQIADLVADKYATLEFSQIATGGDKADVRVKATYRDGKVMNGWLLLRKYGEAWYFAMITRDGHPTTTPVNGVADMDVAKTIAEQQSANQEVMKALLDGGFTKITVNRVTKGSGTAMIDVSFSGGSAAESKGQITCISKTESGTSRWFITGFSK